MIAPARAADWTQAGLTPLGGIPSGSWTQCGSTIGAYAGSAATINTQLAGCAPNQYVSLAAGTFVLSTGIDGKNLNNVALRGAGASQTHLTFNGTDLACVGGLTRCFIRIESTDSTYPHTGMAKIAWNSGYAQGATVVTLANSLGVQAGYTLVLDQCDPGTTGNPCAGNATDNGNLFNCAQGYNSIANPGSPYGCSHDGTGGQTVYNRNTVEYVEVVSCSPSCNNAGSTDVTITPGLAHPNWSSGQTPQAYAIRPDKYVGLENFSIDASGVSTTTHAISFVNMAESWMTGVAILNAKNWGLVAFYNNRMEFRDSYIYNTGRNGVVADSYGMRFNGGHYLIQNNIGQKNRVTFVGEGIATGSVLAYNFCVNDYNASDSMFACIEPHQGGNNDILYEGNAGPTISFDISHGNQAMQTVFRNFFTGWESCGNGQCGAQTFKDFFTNGINTAGAQRYENILANVLGTPGITTTYMTTVPNTFAAYALGQGATNSNGNIPVDTLATNTSYFYGNWDAKTNAVRWCLNSSSTNWANAANCNSTSEVPVGLAIYSQPAIQTLLGDIGAGQSPLPASLYLSSKPAWFGTRAWPAIGPDVSSGNVGQCQGVKNTVGQFALLPALTNAQCLNKGITASGWGGHVNANPAMDVYFTIMGGNPDGTNGPLTFDASYYAAGTAPVVNLTWNGGLQYTFPMLFGSDTVGQVDQTLVGTLTNTGTATLTYSSIALSGTNAADFLLAPGTSSPCTLAGSTLGVGVSCTFNVTFTPSSTGTRTANITVTSNASSSPDIVVVTGVGTPPGAGGTQVTGTLIGMLWDLGGFKRELLDCSPCPKSKNCYDCTKPALIPKVVIH